MHDSDQGQPWWWWVIMGTVFVVNLSVLAACAWWFGLWLAA